MSSPLQYLLSVEIITLHQVQMGLIPAKYEVIYKLLSGKIIKNFQILDITIIDPL